MNWVIMPKPGRPTNDPCKQYTIFLPKSVEKIIEPRGLESRSKRITQLIKIGEEHEKKRIAK